MNIFVCVFIRTSGGDRFIVYIQNIDHIMTKYDLSSRFVEVTQFCVLCVLRVVDKCWMLSVIKYCNKCQYYQLSKLKVSSEGSWESELREVKILSILYLTSNLTLSDDYTDLRLDLNFDNLLNLKREIQLLMIISQLINLSIYSWCCSLWWSCLIFSEISLIFCSRFRQLLYCFYDCHTCETSFVENLQNFWEKQVLLMSEMQLNEILFCKHCFAGISNLSTCLQSQGKQLCALTIDLLHWLQLIFVLHYLYCSESCEFQGLSFTSASSSWESSWGWYSCSHLMHQLHHHRKCC